MILSLLLLGFSFMGNFKTFLFCPSLLLFFLSFEDFIKRENIKNSFSFLGNLTYGLYLLHVPYQLSIIYLFDILSIKINLFNNAIFFFAYFLSLGFIASIVFSLYEKPLNKIIRKRLLNV